MLGGLEHFLMNDVARYGLLAVYITMTLESACIPIPSEVVMPYAGILVAQGHITLWEAGLVGSLANLTGSVIAYLVGRYGGRGAILKYGRYIFLNHRHLAQADEWFAKRGEITVLVARILPVFRTFISLPAGITRMNFVRFVVYSFIGALPWNFVLAYLGMTFADNWDLLQRYLKQFSHTFYALIVVVAAIGLFLWWKKRCR